jgi:CHAT domain
MVITKYYDFVIGVDNINRDGSNVRQFSVRVWESPAGESQAAETVSMPVKLQRNLNKLEKRDLDKRDIINLGEDLAELLLPSQARKLFISSLDKLQSDEGLRLRLMLDPVLANVPWEYLYIQDSIEKKENQDLADQETCIGFCALNPKISIVRHEPLPIGVKLNVAAKTRRLLAALASPQDEPPLDVAKERTNIESALKGIPGIESEFIENTTVELLNNKLISGADIFHFAGHGEFKQSALDSGGGYIVLLGEDGKSSRISAEQLAINLRDHGVQLVVLGACETGRRDEQNAWSGVVTSLMRAGIPATVAMQYKIKDENAIKFSQSFYKALALGYPLDQAVSSGRIAVFNYCESLKDEQQRQSLWRDWGVPVLYCRSKENFVLPAAMDDSQRETLADELKVGNNTAVMNNQSGGVTNSGIMKDSPIIQGHENVVQSGGKYNTYIRTASGPVATGDNPRIVNPRFGTVSNSSIGVAGEGVTIGDVIIGTEEPSKNDLRALFNSILDRVRRRPANPDVDNDEIIQNVERIRDEVLQGLQANLKKIERWLKFLEVAPDIQQAVVGILVQKGYRIPEALRQLAAKILRDE